MQCLGVSSPQKHTWSLAIDTGTQEAVKFNRAFKKTLVQGSSINTCIFMQLLAMGRIPQCEELEFFSWGKDIFLLNI